ncbi:hypothetical protein D6D10_07535 [Aureobasidium pullulans]|uniref:Uncharacterized protein n=1 Tax=Aureobasidium pullulans TaxID=5580 RepID=A0A4S9ELS6_AURPU|nr:hypothetical protein D6D10_07535 [Aureobasidium pullulans]
MDEPLFILLAVPSFLPKVRASYFIQALDIGDAFCNTVFIAGTIISPRWAITNMTDVGDDTCWLAIRPSWNNVDDNAYVNGVHVRCAFTSTNIYIPLTPFNQSLPYNGSSYIVRLISPAPNNITLDSCPFQIEAQGWQPPMSESDKLAQQANNISEQATIISQKANDLANQANKFSHDNLKIAIVGIVLAVFATVVASILPQILQNRYERRQGPVALPL